MAFEGANQLESGEFNPAKLGAAGGIGAAGGAGSLVGKTIFGQMAGAATSAGLAGSTVEMLNQAANSTVNGLGVAVAGLKAAVGGALGAGSGNIASRGIAAVSRKAGATGGAAAGAAIGEATSGTTMKTIDEKLER